MMWVKNHGNVRYDKTEPLLAITMGRHRPEQARTSLALLPGKEYIGKRDLPSARPFRVTYQALNPSVHLLLSL